MCGVRKSEKLEGKINEGDAERVGGVPHSQKRQAENSERGGHEMDGSGSGEVQ